MGLDAIKNFMPLGDRIATAGQPTEGQLSEVAANGFGVVINLGLLDPRYCLPDEAGVVRALGMRYRHIPVKFDAPTPDDFELFLAAMADAPDARVFIHCALNYRVACFMTLYGELRLGWTAEQATAHVRRAWEPNEVWQKFYSDCRGRIRG
jgi:protein tyrosine phosphatase (PTP) superfamily phosphohydrolase (DUF442 family)